MISRKRNLLIFLFGLSVALFVGQSTAHARGWGWVKRLPVSQFTTEDTAIFHQSIKQTLANAVDGERVAWANPVSGAAGTITPLTTEESNGKTCRRTRFESKTPNSANVSEFLLCLQPDGNWSVEEPQ